MKQFYTAVLAIIACSLFSGALAQTTPPATPCASSYLLVSTDPATCETSPTGSCTGSSAANSFRAKIRVYFSTPINIGTQTPNITAAVSGITNLMNDYRFCISGDQGAAVERTYVDYCVYGKNNAGPFPTGTLQLTFLSQGLVSSPACSVLNNIPCPTEFICLSDETGCTTPCDPAYNILSGKIRVFFDAPLPAGVANPEVTAVSQLGVTLNQFKLCADASAATNVERNYVDYCVYTNQAGAELPITNLSLTLQLGSLSARQCLVGLNTSPCPSAFASISTTGNCTPCDPNFPILAGTIRLFFPEPIAAGVPNPEVTALANGTVILNNFKLCAVAGVNTNIERTYADYCVFTNATGSVLPAGVPLTFTIQASECAIPAACIVYPTPELPCIDAAAVVATSTGPGGAGSTAAGCPAQTTCEGLTLFFASKLRVNFAPCLPPGIAAPRIESFTRTLANGTVIRYCLELSAASAALISQERCFVEYCVYSTLNGDDYFNNLSGQLPLNATYTVTVNGNPTDVTQAGCASQQIPLPVAMGRFTAFRNGSHVNLEWETITETNNRGFDIQRLTNGGWETIAFVPTRASGGNSDATLRYNHQDLNPYRGVSQYRLRQMDLDGRAKLSDIRIVKGFGVQNKILIYPNPSTNGQINLMFEDEMNSRDIIIRDMTGRMVKRITGITGNNTTIDHLRSGAYSIEVIYPQTGTSVYDKFVIR